jgi:hypothetical protein
MMFAEARNIDVTNQDHFVMVLCKDSIIDHVCVGQNYLLVFGGGSAKHAGKKEGGGWWWHEKPACQTLLIAFRHPHQGLGISFWCAKKTFSIGILADAFEDGAHRRGESGVASGVFGGSVCETRDGRLCCLYGGRVRGDD